MGDVFAVEIDDVTLGLKAHDLGNETALGIVSTIGLGQLHRQPVERDVGTKHGYSLASTVVDGHHICRKGCGVVVAVVEGVAPLGCVALDHCLEPALLQIVEVVIALLVGKYLVAILGVTPCKGTVTIALLGIISTHKVHAATVYAVAVLHDALHLGKLIVGGIKGALYLVNVVGYLHVDIGQHATGVLVVDKHAGMTVLCVERHKGARGIGEQIVSHTHKHQ